jgi:hypothetical protein
MPEFVAAHESVPGRFCCKSRKLHRSEFFGETLKGEAINDSHNLSRATKVAYEFSARRWGPSDLYTKTATTALRIFDIFCKTTFETLSALFGPRATSDSESVMRSRADISRCMHRGSDRDLG